VAVTVGNQVITSSEILREIRLTSFQNGDPPDFNAASRRKAADRLIEQKLIRKEMELGRYPTPVPADVQTLLEQIKKQHFKTDDLYREALAKYAISEDDLKSQLLWQATLLRFIDIRFRPGIRVSADEIRTYFNKELPELQKKAGQGKNISLDEFRDKIEEALTDERIDKQMDDWLKETRQRTRIVFNEEAF
jgi:hypothetical protein